MKVLPAWLRVATRQVVAQKPPEPTAREPSLESLPIRSYEAEYEAAEHGQDKQDR